MNTKRLSLVVISLGIAIVAVVAFATRREIVEKWREYGISSENPPGVAQLYPEDEAWWREPSGEFDMGSFENLPLSKVFWLLEQLGFREKRLVLHPEETDYAVALGGQRGVVWHEFVRDLLQAASAASQEHYVLSVPEAGESVLGSETRLRTGMYIDFIDVSQLLEASVHVGFPFFNTSLSLNENSLRSLIALRTGWERRWNGRQALLMNEGTLVVWANEDLHGEVRRVVEELSKEVQQRGRDQRAPDG